MCFWAGALINGTFGSSLEGPVQAIWFWTVFGLGLSYLTLSVEMEKDLVGSRIG